MAVVSIKSTFATNRDSTPPKLTSSFLSGSRLHEACGMVAVGTVDSATSKYFFCQIPSNARVSEVKMSASATIGADTACTLDLWDIPTVNAGAVVKSGFFNADIDLQASQAKNLDVGQTTSGANTNIYGTADEQAIWQILGLTSDPNKVYDVIMTSTVDNSATGANVSLKIRYTV